eukprot:c17481_g1_i1.p1 GENE.c17481_g1_i1~~c17481_g1_i1.p1  ORF type:complete len:183 (+),score=22.25 c17481_g1_i1:329-877(+)
MNFLNMVEICSWDATKGYLDNHESIRKSGYLWRSPLMCAIIARDTTMFRNLLSEGFSPHPQLLNAAISSGVRDIIECLLAAGLTLNDDSLSCANNADIVELLLEKRARVTFDAVCAMMNFCETEPDQIAKILRHPDVRQAVQQQKNVPGPHCHMLQRARSQPVCSRDGTTIMLFIRHSRTPS